MSYFLLQGMISSSESLGDSHFIHFLHECDQEVTESYTEVQRH